MRQIVLTGLLCVLAAVSASAQMVVQGGAISSRIPAGATIWYGASAPTNTTGTNGDFYVNTATYCLYGPKTKGAWPASCTSSTQQLGYVAENITNRGVPGGYAPLDSNGHVPAANLPPSTSINGTSVPSNNSSDQTMVTTAPSVGSWAALPSCPDTSGNHLNYSVTTHAFVCGNTGGAAVSVGFGGVSGGVNSGSLLIGGSLGYTGAGQVNANQLAGVSLASLSTGLLKIASGSGTPSTAASSDITATLGFTPENISEKGSANGYAALDANALVPLANLPSITAVNGTSVPANSASDQVVVTTAPASGTWTALPSCADNNGSHLNYSATTHSFLCGSSSANVGFAGLGSGTNANALMVGGSLNYTGVGQINANQLGGVALAGLSTGLLKNTNGTGAPSIAGSSDVTTTLGFTPENNANRNAANGYAPLDANGLLPAANLPTSAVTTSTLGSGTLSANISALSTTGDVNSGGNVNATGNVYANATSNAPGCVHLSDANGAHDMGICAPNSGYSGLVNLWSTAGNNLQVCGSDGAGDLVWQNLGALTAVTSSLATSGTSETTIMSWTAPANSLAAGMTLHFQINGQATSTSGNLTIKFKVGATIVTSLAPAFNSNASAANFSFQGDMTFTAGGSNGLVVGGIEVIAAPGSGSTAAFTAGSGAGVSTSASSINTTVANTISVTATASAGSVTIYQGSIRP